MYRGKFKHLDSLGEDVEDETESVANPPDVPSGGRNRVQRKESVVRTDNLDPEHLKQMVQRVEGVVLSGHRQK